MGKEKQYLSLTELVNLKYFNPLTARHAHGPCRFEYRASQGPIDGLLKELKKNVFIRFIYIYIIKDLVTLLIYTVVIFFCSGILFLKDKITNMNCLGH